MLPSVDSLRCFVAAAETLNFRAAARTVALTPAALGQRIRALESELGTALFRRTTRTVSLTDAGHALLPYARRAVQSTTDCVRAVRGELGAAPMELVCGAPPELAAEWIAPLLPRLARARPDVTLHVHVAHDADLLLRLRTREVDLAVVTTPPREPRVEATLLHEMPVTLAASRALLRSRAFDDPSAAAGHSLLDLSSAAPLFERWRSGAGAAALDMRFGRVHQLGSLAVVESMLLRGEGVAALPHYRLARHLDGGELRALLPSLTRATSPLYLCLRRDDPRRPVLLALAAALRERSPAEA